MYIHICVWNQYIHIYYTYTSNSLWQPCQVEDVPLFIVCAPPCPPRRQVSGQPSWVSPARCSPMPNRWGKRWGKANSRWTLGEFDGECYGLWWIYIYNVYIYILWNLSMIPVIVRLHFPYRFLRFPDRSAFQTCIHDSCIWLGSPVGGRWGL